MRKLLVAALIAVLLVAADQGARVFAQSELRKRAGAAVPEAAAVHAKVSSFPFVGQLVVSGRVTEVALRFDGIRSSRLQLHEVALDLRGVVIDRHALIAEQRGQLNRISRGTVTVDITAAALAAAFGVDLRVVMRLGPSGLAGLASAAAEGGRLVLRFAGLPAASVVIPRGDLVPCQPLVAVTSAGVRLSCTFTHIPPRLIGAVNRAGATAP
ncbi:MAG: DUF2993 domain-containing protein [Actinobacteria bacterium]|nr:MAG: DUF2993 domain-containing protein [Actinomycetota bacterium]